MTSSTPIRTAADVRRHLADLYAERALAAVEGLSSNPGYADDLAREIAVTSSAYVGVAVTEIATLRGELSGRPQG